MDIVISGVGGQGTVLASRIIGECAIDKGLEVRTSEIIGMAQREGSVISQVRMGQNLYGGLIPNGRADILLGFELAEAVRAVDKLKAGGVAIVNTQSVVPPSVYLGLARYDVDALKEAFSRFDFNTYFIDALDLARQAGNLRAVSAVMLGAFSCLGGHSFGCRDLNDKLTLHLPDKLVEVNERAFALGQKTMEVLVK